MRDVHSPDTFTRSRWSGLVIVGACLLSWAIILSGVWFVVSLDDGPAAEIAEVVD